MQPIDIRKTTEPIKVIDGHKFWLVSQADQMLHSRYMVAEIQELYIRSGLSQDFLLSIAQILIDRAMDAKDFRQFREDMIAVGQNLKGRLSFMAEAVMYEELACVYTLMDDEPLEYLPEWQVKKKSVWSADRDFFLCEAFKLIHSLNDISESDILAALLAADERIKQLPTLPE